MTTIQNDNDFSEVKPLTPNSKQASVNPDAHILSKEE